jgi:hypothetical protein
MAGTSAGLWGVDGAWAQNGTLTFSRALAGADRVWEVIGEAPALTIPRAGIWEVSYQARGVALLPANAAQGLGVTVGLFKDGALLPGSEAMAAFISIAAAAPAFQVQATGARQFVHSFTAGQTIQLAAYRIGPVGNASVVSNGDGRTFVSAHWIGPPGDTAS